MLERRSHGIHKKINEFPLFEALRKSLSIFVFQELEDQVYGEESFTIDSMKQYYHEWIENAPKMLSKTCRAATESLICHHFGEEIVEPLFETHTRVLCEKFMAGEDIGWCQITVALQVRIEIIDM